MMRKAILEINMPETCGTCQLCQGIDMAGEHICSILDSEGNERGYDDGKYGKPDWCPLVLKREYPEKHGYWFLLDECANEGVYCSVCSKKVYKTNYANQKLKSKFCPNCGAIMDGEFKRY